LKVVPEVVPKNRRNRGKPDILTHYLLDRSPFWLGIDILIKMILGIE
jgi:hypothetical protein